MRLFVEPELALLVSWAGVGVAKTGIGVSKPGIGFSKPGIGFSKPGIGFSKPGIEFSKPGIEVLKAAIGSVKAVIEVSKPAIGIARAGIVIYSFLPREVRRARHPLCMFRPVSPCFSFIILACSQRNARSYIRKTSPAKMFQPFSHRVFVLDFSRKRAERLVFQTFQKVSVFLLLPMLSGRCGQARRKNYDETEDFCQIGRFHRMFEPLFSMKTGPRKQTLGKTFDEKGDFCVWRAFPCYGSLWREWLLNLTVGKSPMWRFKAGLWIFSPRD